MITLAIETSTPQGSVAVTDGASVLFVQEFFADRGHSSELFLALERMVAAVPPADQIAVGLGPGSYSGVRVAISAALGLALTSGARMLGVSSIAAFDVEAEEYVAIGDARRGMFHFSRVRNSELVEGPILVDPDALREKVHEAALPVYSSEKLNVGVDVAPQFPSATKMALLASRGCAIFSRDELEPMYLRDAYITAPASGP